MSQPRLIIFDLDGTLFRTETVDIRAFNDALTKNGYPSKQDGEILSVIGLTLPEACGVLLETQDPQVIAKISADIIDFEDEYIKIYGQLYDRVPEMLNRLKRAGYTLGICSNGNEEYVLEIADKFNLAQYFEAIRYSRDGISKTQAVGLLKRQFNADRFIMVGDRSSDIEAARSNGGISLGAAYGFGGAEVEAADFIAHSIEDVEAIITRELS